MQTNPSGHGRPSWRAIEFFAGIGGFATAWPNLTIVSAIDINQHAQQIYSSRFSHPFVLSEIESLSDEQLLSWDANFWWLSPPCQPYSRRGQQRDVEDPRSRSLVRLIAAIPLCRPAAIALENVVGFQNSRAHQQLLDALRKEHYHIQSLELCPTQMGWPNKRPRFYLLASLLPLDPWQPLPEYDLRLSQFLDLRESDKPESDSPWLWLDCNVAEKYRDALDRVSIDDDSAVTACFAGSYGKAIVRAGSYLQIGERFRRFTPQEVANLLGYAEIDWESTRPRVAWKLLGNSLSIPAMRYLLSHLPGGPTCQLSLPGFMG